MAAPRPADPRGARGPVGAGASAREWLAVGALWILLGIVMAVWVTVDRRPPEWDHANHLERALHCHRVLAGPGQRLGEVLELSAFYPPLAICAAGLAYFVLPPVPLTAQVVIWLFLGVGLASVLALGRRLWDGPTGVLAAFVFGTAPFVVFSLTNFQLDLPLAAMVALALHVQTRAEGFIRPGWAVAHGFVLGLGMLTKPTFAVYLVGPLAWAAWEARRVRPARGWLALSLVIAAALALPWYGPRLLALPMQVSDRSFKFAAAEGHAPALSVAGLLFYPRYLIPVFGALATALAVWGLWAIARDRSRGLVWSATLVPLVVMTLSQNKNLRYALPMLPAAALAAAAGVRAVPRAWRPAAGLAVIALGLLQVSMAAFAVPRPPHLALFHGTTVFNHAPARGDWQHDRIVADLLWLGNGQALRTAVVPNYNFLSVSTLRYEAVRRAVPIVFARAWDAAPFGVDVAVVKTGSQGPSYTAARPERIMQSFAEDPYLQALYPVVAEYPLPDGSRAALRARRPPVVEAPPAEIARRLTSDPGRFLGAYLREARGLAVSLDYDADAIREGRIRRATIQAESALLGEVARRDRALLRAENVQVVVEDVLFDARRLMDRGELALLDAGALRLERLTLLETDLAAFLRGQRAGRGATVTMGDGGARVSLRRFGTTLAARARAVVPTDGRPFALVVEDVRIGPVPVPGPLVDWVVRHFDPTLKLRRLPIAVLVAPIEVKSGRIEIGLRPP